MTRNKKIFWLPLMTALVAACGGEALDTPRIDPTEVSLASGGKADTSDVQVGKAGGGYYRVALHGDVAKDLWGVMEAGAFKSAKYGSLSYLVGVYSICATNGSAAACHVYSRGVKSPDGRFEATVHGPRFASAASELFGGLAAYNKVNPASTTSLESAHIACAKDASKVWCGFDADKKTTGETLSVSFSGLEKLGAGFVYEGWLITPAGPQSAGRFSDPEGYTIKVDPAVAKAATLYVLTIEPEQNDDPEPSATHVVAGPLTKGRAALSTSHPAALGTDFAAALGSFILATPSSPAADDFDQGIWFLDPTAGPAASLSLPTLPAGWAYEGWVVTGGKPVSTGRFTSTSGADSDGAGPAAGPGAAPPFPGQDFISPPLILPGGKAVISVEPEPDDSPAPFALKPLVGDILAKGEGEAQGLGNNASATAITGVAILESAARGPRVVVANRGAGSISIIDARSDELLWTVPLPGGGEPMYVTYDQMHDRIFVGDRKNDRVVAFSAADLSVEGTAPAGKGVFHMWDSPDDRTLWVVNDVDKTLAAIDQETLELARTVAIPADLAAAGGKPHDVVVDPYGHAVYTTVVGLPQKSVVVKLSALSGKELARADVGGDAHLSVGQKDSRLYVPCQEADSLYVLSRYNLTEQRQIKIPGAHGVTMTSDAAYLYVGNLPASGPMAVYTVDLAQQALAGAPVDVPSDGKPHNLAVSDDGAKLYLTHSGPGATRVTALSLASPAQPKIVANLDTDTNPFGLVFFRR
jgi:DNA-binding beta-propeller fold protein YncE